MNILTKLHVSKYMYMGDSSKLRTKELVINAALFLMLCLMGSITNLIYYTEYISAQVSVQPKDNFVMEANLNGDLFKADRPDFMFYPSADTLLMPNR